MTYTILAQFIWGAAVGMVGGFKKWPLWLVFALAVGGSLILSLTGCKREEHLTSQYCLNTDTASICCSDMDYHTFGVVLRHCQLPSGITVDSIYNGTNIIEEPIK